MEHTKATALREARKRAGITAEVLATRAGISLGWLRTCERAPSLMSEELAARLAGALGVDPRVLLMDRLGSVRFHGAARRMVF